MSDPFVKDNPWTLRHAALPWEASAAGLLVEGKVDERKKACFLSGWSKLDQEIIDQRVLSLTSCVLANSLVLGKQIK